MDILATRLRSNPQNQGVLKTKPQKSPTLASWPETIPTRIVAF